MKSTEGRQNQEPPAIMTASRTAADILDVMAEGVLLLDMQGRIRSINPALEKMSGIPGRKVIGQHLGDILPTLLSACDQAMAMEALARAQQGAAPVLPPVTLLSRTGRRIPLMPALTHVRGTGNRPTAIVVTLRDISQLRAMEDSLVESERRYRELVENANSIIMRIAPDDTITFFNEYAQSFFGYTADEVMGKNVIGTIVPERDSEGNDLRAMLAGITAHPELYGTSENENMRKDGKRVWVHWANRAVRDKQGSIVEILCVGTDITRRREMEAEAERYQERLRSLAEKLAARDEKDRWQISRYIHDTIIQNLSLSSMKLGSMEEPLTAAQLGEEMETLQAIRKLIGDAIAECRNVMSELTPSLLYELGLVPALHDLAENIREQHKVPVHVRAEGEIRPMSPALLGLLFQSARELIMNALKHAGRSDIHVSVAHTDGSIVICVQDNGKGFDPAKLDRHDETNGGFGLFSVRERVEGLGGRLEILSAPGKGTTTRITVPMRDDGVNFEV